MPLFGNIIALFIYSKIIDIRFDKALLVFMPPLILLYSVMKIGCFCAGCCYGIPYNGIGHITLNNNNVFPVQIVESFYNMALFIAIIILQRNNKDNMVCKGIILFEVGKFAFSFLRNVQNEPMFLGISLSQYVLLILIIVTLQIFKKLNF